MKKQKVPKLLLINIENHVKQVAPLAAFGYMSAFLKDRIAYSGVKQMNVVFDKPGAIQQILKEEPTIVGFRTISIHHNLVQKLSKTLSEDYKIPVIWGGPHVTSVPKDIPAYVSCAVIGDGEETITELMQMFLKTGTFESDDLMKIKGLSFHHKGQVVSTDARPQISDLNSIPCPDYSICDADCFVPRERWLRLGVPVTGIPYMTSRGCAFRCIFCQPSVYEGKYRHNSMDKAFSDLKFLQARHGAEVFALYDPIFANHASRIRDFHEAAARHGLLDTFYYIQLFARNFNEDMARELSKMKTYRVFFGLESGSEKILKYLKNGIVSIKDNERACRLSEKYKLRTEAVFLTGVPTETEEDLELSKEFIKREYIGRVQIGQLYPQPGTKLWQHVQAQGIVPSSNINWDKLGGRGILAETQTTPFYLNPSLPKPVYEKHCSELHAIGREKNRKGRLLFTPLFRHDLALLGKRLRAKSDLALPRNSLSKVLRLGWRKFQLFNFAAAPLSGRSIYSARTSSSIVSSSGS